MTTRIATRLNLILFSLKVLGLGPMRLRQPPAPAVMGYIRSDEAKMAQWVLNELAEVALDDEALLTLGKMARTYSP